MSNVIQCSLQTLHSEAVAAGVASQTSKLSERRKTTTNADPDPGCMLINITQWQEKRYEGSRRYARGLAGAQMIPGIRTAVAMWFSASRSCTSSRWHRSQEHRNGLQTARGTHTLIRGDGY